MRKPIRPAVAFVAGALLTGLTATASMAATAKTWSVSPGGTITGGTIGGFEVEDASLDVPVLNCTASVLGGSLKSGHGLKGGGIGMATSVTFSNCSIQGHAASVSTGTVKWPLTTVSYSSGVTHGNIRKIHFAVSSSICSYVVDGTSATARDGKVKVTYSNSTDQLKISPFLSNLHLYSVVGCGGLGANLDPASVTTTYTITPGQTITSP